VISDLRRNADEQGDLLPGISGSCRRKQNKIDVGQYGMLNGSSATAIELDWIACSPVRKVAYGGICV
jgi:hypothetical protein